MNSSAIGRFLYNLLPYELYRIAPPYQSFKIHSFYIKATLMSSNNIPVNANNIPIRLVIGADPFYRASLFPESTASNINAVGAAIDYADLMQLPNVRTRDLLLSNLNNGSSLSVQVKPSKGMQMPYFATSVLERYTATSIPDSSYESTGNFTTSNV